ncbi:MAG: TldD/PmbA family protein, partial [Pseudonocardiaceae bacterium]|nr:TldD/PmbA family protein [Pseudonocardiaceae bacterium]
MIGTGSMGTRERVDTALAASRSDGCLVLVTETSEATLRWANSTMTTNGHTTSRQFSVVSVIGDSVGVVGGTGTDADEVRGVVAASEDAARQSGPARDAAPLVTGAATADFAEPAAQTSIGVFAQLAEQLAAAFGESRARGDLLYGFAEHRLETSWLASSTGLRRRWVQPTGTIEINGKAADDLARSAWVGDCPVDFTTLELDALTRELRRRLDWSARRLDLPAGRYETILPPSATADLMIDLVQEMDGRPAHEGRSAFSAPSGGGTRVGERLTGMPLALVTDPAEPDLRSEPFLTTIASSDAVSVFDNGAPLGRTEWLRD